MAVFNKFLENVFSLRHTNRNLHVSAVKLKHVVLKNAKNKTASSQQWLLRQLRDPYVELAKIRNYRCRSAFKLLEIDDKYNILRPGQIVIDCGSSPGSWTQVAVKRVNSDGNQKHLKVGTVVSIDKQSIYPIEGAKILGNCDFTKAESQIKVVELLNNKQANIILSDMAPNATGLRELDIEQILNLCYSVARFSLRILQVDTQSALLMKLWDCCEKKKLETELLQVFRHVRCVKPKSSRQDSSEIFLLATDFKGECYFNYPKALYELI